MRLRMKSVIEFLRRGDEFMERVDVVVGPTNIGSNMLFVGDHVAFEGLKGSLKAGFSTTFVHTDVAGIKVRREVFEQMFRESHEYMLSKYGHLSNCANDRSRRREITVKLLEKWVEESTRRMAEAQEPIP